jgi:hypothetical protein
MIVVGAPVRKMDEDEALTRNYAYNPYSIDIFRDWAIAVSEISHPNYQVYIVDNSDNEEFVAEMERVCEKLPMNYILHYLPGMRGKYPEERIAQSFEVIRKYALEVKADYMLTLGADVMVPRNVINILQAEIDKADFVMPMVKTRRGTGYYYSYCCCLLSRKSLEATDFLGWGYCDRENPHCWYMNDGWVITKLLRSGLKYKLIEKDLYITHVDNRGGTKCEH